MDTQLINLETNVLILYYKIVKLYKINLIINVLNVKILF